MFVSNRKRMQIWCVKSPFVGLLLHPTQHGLLVLSGEKSSNLVTGARRLPPGLRARGSSRDLAPQRLRSEVVRVRRLAGIGTGHPYPRVATVRAFLN